MRRFRSLVLFCSILVVGAFSLANAQPAPTPAPAPAPVAVEAPAPAPQPVPAPVATPAPAPQPAPAPVVAAPPAPASTPTPVPAPVAAEVVPPTPVEVPADTPTDTPTAKEDSKASVIGGAVLQIFIVLLTISLPIILTPFVRLLMKKLKVTDIEMQEHINDIIGKGVVIGLNYAEEQAHKLRDNPVESAEKLNMAADKTIEYLKESGIVDKGAEYIKALIEAKLGETRKNGSENPETPDA